MLPPPFAPAPTLLLLPRCEGSLSRHVCVGLGVRGSEFERFLSPPPTAHTAVTPVCVCVCRSLSGYVQQQDVHIGTATVREALELSAVLRLPASVTTDQRTAMVDEVRVCACVRVCKCLCVRVCVYVYVCVSLWFPQRVLFVLNTARCVCVCVCVGVGYVGAGSHCGGADWGQRLQRHLHVPAEATDDRPGTCGQSIRPVRRRYVRVSVHLCASCVTLWYSCLYVCVCDIACVCLYVVPVCGVWACVCVCVCAYMHVCACLSGCG